MNNNSLTIFTQLLDTLSGTHIVTYKTNMHESHPIRLSCVERVIRESFSESLISLTSSL
jgi:hypothetical protein